ncbi:MAG: hypothetical protein ABIK11_04315 [candidate division WOR-3 bacterium]
MKRKAFLLLFPAVIYSQVLVIDTTIVFPSRISRGIYFSEFDKLYISGDGSFLYAVSCSTYKVDTIALGIPRSVDFFSYNWRQQKLYLSVETRADRIVVIDVAKDTVLKELYFEPGRLWGHCYVSSSNRLYIGCSDSLLILDCSNDSIIGGFLCPVERFFVTFVSWDSVHNEVYAVIHQYGSPAWLAVYDCSSDSLLSMFRVPHMLPYKIYFHYRLNKGYFLPYDEALPGVIDIQQHQFIKYFPIPIFYATLEPIAIDTLDHKVYISKAKQRWPDTLYVIDCLTDSIIKKLVEAGWGPLSVRWAAWSNRLYFTGGPRGETLKVLDCRTDSVIDRVYLEEYSLFGPPDIELDPVRHRIFAIGCDSALYVLRELEQGVEEERSNNPGRSAPTVVRGVLYLPERAGAAGKPVLVDITGRRVRELVPGANDVRGLVPGVYFVRSNAGVERKVVIAR